MSGLPWLDDKIWFPDPERALCEPDGLLCAGGDLSEDRLIAAYRQGIFPWFCKDQPILWWSPELRCILDLDNLHISRSMKRTLNNPQLSYTFDQRFNEVVKGCMEPRSNSDETWITQDMLTAYNTLHKKGLAHSIEVWHQDQLIGGLYGVTLGRCFFGESMFSRKPNASKYAFIKLASHLKNWGCMLFDCQVPNSHLLSLGASVIPRKTFLLLLNKYRDGNSPFYWQTNPTKAS